MSNACFGKTMENLRKRSKIAFVGNVRQAESMIMKTNIQIIQYSQ